MCNKYRSRLAIEALLGGIPDLRTPSGLPNLEPRDEISITDTAPIIMLDDEGAPSLVQMRWSWPGPGGKPVYNFRSEGRRLTSGRCLIPADGFYEFTDPEPPAPKRAQDEVVVHDDGRTMVLHRGGCPQRRLVDAHRRARS